ncbi:MAG: hypothetical protein ACRDX8_02475 [Acidimicrobiales bacterium]
MAIHTKLTVKESAGRQPVGAGKASGGAGTSARRPPTEEERAIRKARVAAAKDALARSVGLRGDHVAPARAALKTYLRRLNEAHQPSDDQFQALVEGPFRVPPKPRGERR